MSFKEVKELRKSGSIEEALTKALEDLQNDPEDIWNKRSIAWVYYDLLKKEAESENIDSFIQYLQKINELSLPEEEHMVFDNLAYQIGKVIFMLNRKEHFDKRVDQIFDLIKPMHFTRRSESYSFLYKSFHKGYKNWARYNEFAEWWDFSNFRSEDYLPEEYNGRKIMALAEQAYIAYSKALLEGTSTNIFGHKTADKEKIMAFMPQLDTIIEQHPEYKYPPFFKAKLLLKIGDKENVLSAFLPFAKSKRNDFWVWDLMAETFENDDSKKMACLCKALSLRTPEGFLINTRQKLAELLIKQGLYNEAKTEIEQIISIRSDNEWKLPQQIKEWISEPWYESAVSLENNSVLYKKHATEAEELLYADVPEEVLAVEFVNRNKKILNFVKDRQTNGFFKYGDFIESPQIGDLLKVRFTGEPREKFYKALTIEKADPDTQSPAIKIFGGSIRIIEPHNFGFVEDVFVEPSLVKDNEFQQGQSVQGKAILSYDKKKDEWGWKAITLSISNHS